jgi:hypothetical protein
MVEFMQQGTTVTSEVYSETLKKLHRAIQNKGHGMLTSGVVDGRCHNMAELAGVRLP